MARDLSNNGLMLVAGCVLAATAFHWFITPPSHVSSGVRRFAVATQLVVGLVLAFIAWRRWR